MSSWVPFLSCRRVIPVRPDGEEGKKNQENWVGFGARFYARLWVISFCFCGHRVFLVSTSWLEFNEASICFHFLMIMYIANTGRRRSIPLCSNIQNFGRSLDLWMFTIIGAWSCSSYDTCTVFFGEMQAPSTSTMTGWSWVRILVDNRFSKLWSFL